MPCILNYNVELVQMAERLGNVAWSTFLNNGIIFGIICNYRLIPKCEKQGAFVKYVTNINYVKC